MKVVKLPELSDDDADTSVTVVCKFCECTLLLEEGDLRSLTSRHQSHLDCKVCKQSIDFAKDEASELADQIRRSIAYNIVAELRSDAPNCTAFEEAIEARQVGNWNTIVCLLFGFIAFIVGMSVRK